MDVVAAREVDRRARSHRTGAGQGERGDEQIPQMAPHLVRIGTPAAGLDPQLRLRTPFTTS